MKEVNVGLVFHPTFPGNLKDNLSRVDYWVREADSKKVNILLFPEYNVTGYINSKEDLEFLLPRLIGAEQELLKLSKEVETVFSCGYPVKIKGEWYVTHSVFYKGRILGRHFKTHLPPSEQETYSQADLINVIKTPFGNLGIQLCYETHYPELSTLQAMRGADFLLMGFASSGRTSKEKIERLSRFLPARAYDNTCFLIASNMSGNTISGTRIPGAGLICNHLGEIVEFGGGEEALLYYTCNLEEMRKRRESTRGYFLQNRRSRFLKANL